MEKLSTTFQEWEPMIKGSMSFSGDLHLLLSNINALNKSYFPQFHLSQNKCFFLYLYIDLGAKYK